MLVTSDTSWAHASSEVKDNIAQETLICYKMELIEIFLNIIHGYRNVSVERKKEQACRENSRDKHA